MPEFGISLSELELVAEKCSRRHNDKKKSKLGSFRANELMIIEKLPPPI